MMSRHSEFEYIESSVVVRAYTLGGRLNAYKLGDIVALNGKQIPRGDTIPPGRKSI